MENLIILKGDRYQIPLLLGLFGRDELVYESEFDESVYSREPLQIYSCSKLNSKIYIYKDIHDFIKTPVEKFNNFDKKIVVLDSLSNSIVNNKIKLITNCKSIFIWHFGELFESSDIQKVYDLNLDYVLSGSKRPELENYDRFELDLLLPFRFFRYYIGYYYLEDLVNSIELPKYDTNKPKLFSYVRYRNSSNWRNEILKSIDGLETLLTPKNSANDSYDLVYPKYKHFEAINDYIYCNFNLIFETIDYRNSLEFFITEKTFKGLFFGKPFLLAAPVSMLNFLRDRGFHITNFEFVDKIENPNDVLQSIKLFTDWLKSATETEIENRYNELLEKSKKNKDVLMNYLNNYEHNFDIFKKLLEI